MSFDTNHRIKGTESKSVARRRHGGGRTHEQPIPVCCLSGPVCVNGDYIECTTDLGDGSYALSGINVSEPLILSGE